MARRLFTVAEANRLIPWLTEVLTRLQQIKRQLDQQEAVLAHLYQRARRNGTPLPPDHLRRARQQVETLLAALQQGLAQIQEQGCELKDLDLGLVDFPSEREGRLVYLCWQLGEPRVAYWHELDAGFRGRQPL